MKALMALWWGLQGYAGSRLHGDYVGNKGITEKKNYYIVYWNNMGIMEWKRGGGLVFTNCTGLHTFAGNIHEGSAACVAFFRTTKLRPLERHWHSPRLESSEKAAQ